MPGRNGFATLAALLLSAGSPLLLWSCSAPPPPPLAQDSLEQLTARVEALPGVVEVDTRLRELDPKDRPDQWVADVDVTAKSSDLLVATDVVEAASGGVRGAELTLTLKVPGGPGVAPVTFDPRESDDVSFASRLRTVPDVRSVSAGPGVYAVAVVDSMELSATVDAVRLLLEGRAVDIRRSSPVSIGVTETAPAGDILAVLDAVADDPATRDLSFFAPADTGSRASIAVRSDRPQEVAARLAATADALADEGRAPRTSFSVSDPGYTVTSTGFVGSPLGSAEPDDLVDLETPPVPDPPGDAPVSEPPPRAEAEAAVRSFLAQSAAATTVAASPEVATRWCPTAGESQAVGRVVMPVFEVYDSGDEPLAAVTSLWRDSGMREGERAMGRDFWRQRSAVPDGVLTASIRGTIDGLSLTAESGCAPS